MYKLIIVSAVLALAAAKPDIIAPLGYSSPALEIHEPAIPVAPVPVAAPAVEITPTLRYAAAAPAFTAPLTYPAPAITYSSPLAWSGYAAAPAALPAYNYGFDAPSYYWKKR